MEKLVLIEVSSFYRCTFNIVCCQVMKVYQNDKIETWCSSKKTCFNNIYIKFRIFLNQATVNTKRQVGIGFKFKSVPEQTIFELIIGAKNKAIWLAKWKRINQLFHYCTRVQYEIVLTIGVR